MTLFRRWATLLIVAFGLAACSAVPPQPNGDADIIVIGDSILAWQRGSARSIPSVIEGQTGLSVSNVSVSGARFLGAGGIPSQYVDGNWDWVILDGGGNDLLPWCGTDEAQIVLDSIISADGTVGAMPSFITRVTTQGAQVILLGYYPVSDRGGRFLPCRSVLDELSLRQERFAATNPNVVFVDAGLVISASDSAAYAADLVHPSPRGVALVGQLTASKMRPGRS